MKKLHSVLAVLLLVLFCAVPVTVWADSQSTIVRYNVQAVVVYQDYDGTSATQHVDVGTLLHAPAPKGKPGCRFEGWRDEKTGLLWDFAQPVTEHLTLTASYSEFKEDADGDVPIGDGEFSVAVRVETSTTDASVGTSSKDILNMLLQDGSITTGEIDQVAAGAALEVVLVVKDGADSVSAASKALLAQTAGGYTVGQYLDISLVKYLTVDGQPAASQLISETSGPITVTVDIPAALRNTDPNVERRYVIVRNHEGRAEILPSTYDAAAQTLTFETNLFSDYAIAYQDTRKPSNTQTGETQQPGSGDGGLAEDTAVTSPATGSDATGGHAPLLARFIPQTSDPAHIFGYYLAWVASAVMLAWLYAKRRRNR